MWFIWFLLLFAFVLLRWVTRKHFLDCFVLGAFSTLIISLTPIHFVFQWGLFIAISSVFLMLFYYITKKDTPPSHLTDLIGTTALVTQTIGPSPFQLGEVIADSEHWVATTSLNHIIPEGTEVLITDIRGLHLVVSPAHLYHHIKKAD